MLSTLSDERMGLIYWYNSFCALRDQPLYDHTLLSHLTPINLEGQVPAFMSPRDRVAQTPPGTGFITREHVGDVIIILVLTSQETLRHNFRSNTAQGSYVYTFCGMGTDFYFKPYASTFVKVT
jgi:hypothetical protein